MKKFLKDNLIVWIWVGLFIFVELFSICFTDCKPYLTSPFYLLFLICLFTLILTLIPNKIAKGVITSVLLLGVSGLCVGFVYLYEQNGTQFDFSMIKMRDDGLATIEDLTFNVAHMVTLICICAAYITFVVLYLIRCKKTGTLAVSKNNLGYKIASSIATVAMCGLIIGVPLVDGIKSSNDHYTALLYNNTQKYQSLGITGNAVYEMVSGVSQKVDLSDLDQMEAYLYEGEDALLQTSTFNGISQGNNLVMIMVESWDWYPLTWYDFETTKLLYPNLVKLMGESVVLNNFHAREKTDTSEINALIGSNPTNKYVNYDFEDNSYPYAIPNMFKSANPDATINAFHQNTGNFYNRDKLFPTIGFDDYYDIARMKEYGLVDTYNDFVEDDNHTNEAKKKERTRDSLTMAAMKEVMFPTNKQYFSYWLTYSMHGYYVERDSFKNFVFEDEDGVKYENGYYGYFDALGVFPKSNVTKANYLRTYAAAVKDFDIAIGMMMNYLESTNQLDHTTIVMYADHNTYYNNLAHYAKDVELGDYTSELYRVPCVIYDQDLAASYALTYGEEAKQVILGNDNSDFGKCNVINKFTTTTDLIPTILDLFGIDGWSKLYFGTSVFVEDVESIIYSRAYGIFVTDKILCYSLNAVLHTTSEYTEEYKQSFIIRAKKHLTKLEYLDKVYYSDYFSNHEYKIPA